MLHHVHKSTVPRSSYPDLYIPALNNLWCHTGSTQPVGRGKYSLLQNEAASSCLCKKTTKITKNSYRIKRFLHSYLNPEPALFIQITDLVDDAAGEEGGRFLTVCMETERHQSVGPHREVVVHGQNLRRKSSVCFIVQLSASAGQALTCHERHRCSSISTERKNSPLVYESRRLLMLPGLSI